MLKPKRNQQIRKIKPKKNDLSSSPQDSEKIDKSNNQNIGKENNCMNKVKTEIQQPESNNDQSQTPKSISSTKMKKVESALSKDLKSSDSEGYYEESKEIEDLKAFLKNLCKSKRKVLIKPNIPQKWINDLKAKLAKLQVK